MADQLTKEQVDLLNEKYIAQLVTLMSDGSPHISPLWVDTDGQNVLINTEEGRVKTANMRRDARVAVGLFDAANPYTRVLNIRGTVVGITSENARQHIDDLSEKYNGVRPYPSHNPDKDRLIVTIRPDRVY
jgi:PPOX class probable F420-dependent enzyme